MRKRLDRLKIDCRVGIYILIVKMDSERVNKFFKAYANNQTYKIFLDDVSVIYKVVKRKTPRLQSYAKTLKPNG